MKSQSTEELNKSVGKILSDIALPISIIADIVSIAVVILSTDRLIRVVTIATIIICGTLILILILRKVLSVNKAKQEFERSYFDDSMFLAKRMHNYYHNLRNYIVSADTANTKEIVKMNSIQICNYIGDFYRSLFYDYLSKGKYDVSVCIKLIETDDVFEEDYNKWRLETFSRSTSTEQARGRIDRMKINVADNTDFLVILSDEYENTEFAFPDMRRIKDEFLLNYEKPYLNSRKNFWKYYRSTIVAPIKISGNNASEKLKEMNPSISSKDIVLGFLCIDSMKYFSSESELRAFELGVEFAKGFADSLYVYFERVLISRINSRS